MGKGFARARLAYRAEAGKVKKFFASFDDRFDFAGVECSGNIPVHLL